MKRYFFVFLLAFSALIGFISANNTYAEDDLSPAFYIFGNGGVGRGDIGGSGGVDLGITLKPNSKIGYLFGAGGSVTDRNDTPSEFKNKENSAEWEGCFAFGIRPIIKKLYLVGTVGVSVREYDKTYSGSIYKEGYVTETEENFTTSGQIRYIVWKGLMVGGGYHNRRGVLGGIGWAF